MPKVCGERLPPKIHQILKVHINREIKQPSPKIQQINVKSVQFEAIPNLAIELNQCEARKMEKQRENRLLAQRPPTRIPTPMHHTNQIIANASSSSSASTLWNSIYERHLLSQTKFDCTSNAVMPIHHIRPNDIDGVIDRPTSRTLIGGNEWPVQMNQNRQRPLPRRRLSVHSKKLLLPPNAADLHESRNAQAITTENELKLANGLATVMYAQPSVIETTVNVHNKQFAGKICNKTSALLLRPSISTTNEKSNRIVALERGQPVGGNFTPNAMRPQASPAPSTANTARTSLSVLSAVNAKVGCNTFKNAITGLGDHCDVGGGHGGGGSGESTLPTTTEYSAQSKINLMLETAQAMAAAAYFARFVSHYFLLLLFFGYIFRSFRFVHNKFTIIYFPHTFFSAFAIRVDWFEVAYNVVGVVFVFSYFCSK